VKLHATGGREVIARSEREVASVTSWSLFMKLLLSMNGSCLLSETGSRLSLGKDTGR